MNATVWTRAPSSPGLRPCPRAAELWLAALVWVGLLPAGAAAAQECLELVGAVANGWTTAVAFAGPGATGSGPGYAFVGVRSALVVADLEAGLAVVRSCGVLADGFEAGSLAGWHGAGEGGR